VDQHDGESRCVHGELLFKVPGKPPWANALELKHLHTLKGECLVVNYFARTIKSWVARAVNTHVGRPAASVALVSTVLRPDPKGTVSTFERLGATLRRMQGSSRRWER